MKKITILSVCLSMGFLNACASTPKPTLVSPQAGVLCDQYVCADQTGLSESLTRQYLGAQQAQAVFGQGAFDTSAFTFANGVFCDTETKLCHVDRYFDADSKRSAVDAATTQRLFPSQGTQQ